MFEIYEKNIFFKPVVLADKKRIKQDLYWLVVPEKRKCLSSETEFKKDGMIKRIVIDEKKVLESIVFLIDYIKENFIIVNLDVAESILRRGLIGIKFKKIETEAVKG